MKENLYLLTTMVVLLLGSLTSAQDLNKDLSAIFGKPVKGKPNTYKFSSKYIVEIEKRADGQITRIYLHSNKYIPKGILSQTEINDFFKKVNTIRDIGKPVLKAVIGFRYFEDVYENAHVHRYLSIIDDDDEQSYLVGIRVVMPYKVEGVITAVGGEKPRVKMEMGKCLYYSFNDGVKVGDTGEFWVIDAGIIDINGECIESNLNLSRGDTTERLN